MIIATASFKNGSFKNAETALTKEVNSNKMQDRTENQKAEKRNSTWTERQRERIGGERSFREDREPALEQSAMSRTQALALEKQKRGQPEQLSN